MSDPSRPDRPDACAVRDLDHLLGAVRRGDAAAWAAVAEHQAAVMLGVARRYCPGAAEDVVQDVLAVLPQATQGYRRQGGDDRRARAWLLACTANIARARARSEIRRQGREAAVGAAAPVAADDAAVHAAIELDETLALALAALDPQERELLLRYHAQPEGRPALARRLACSATALRMRVHRLLRRCREQLRHAGALCLGVLGIRSTGSGLGASATPGATATSTTASICSGGSLVLPISIGLVASGSVLLATLALPVSSVVAADHPETSGEAEASEPVAVGDPAAAVARLAVFRGEALAWLVAQQNPDGSWGQTETEQREATAVATMVLLTNGYFGTAADAERPQRDQRRTVARALRWLRAAIGADAGFDPDNRLQALAAMVLSEVAVMNGERSDRLLATRLQHALLARVRWDASGRWCGWPPRSDGELVHVDAETTTLATVALKSGRVMGLGREHGQDEIAACLATYDAVIAEHGRLPQRVALAGVANDEVPAPASEDAAPLAGALAAAWFPELAAEHARLADLPRPTTLVPDHRALFAAALAAGGSEAPETILALATAVERWQRSEEPALAARCWLALASTLAQRISLDPPQPAASGGNDF